MRDRPTNVYQLTPVQVQESYKGMGCEYLKVRSLKSDVWKTSGLGWGKDQRRTNTLYPGLLNLEVTNVHSHAFPLDSPIYDGFIPAGIIQCACEYPVL